MTPLLTGRAHSTLELNSIHHCDALTFLSSLPRRFVDIVVTSPPYNLRNTTGGEMSKKTGMWSMGALAHGYADHNDNMPHDQYIAWQRQCLHQMMRVTSDDGAIFYNHKWRVQDGHWQRLADKITDGFPVRQIIIWKRSGGINFNAGYFVPTYEVIYLIAKRNFRLALGANSYSDVWEITQESDNPHPAPFPIELPRRCISSTNAKVVCDPFMGSGTTAVAARELGRDYIGCDITAHYIDMANKRLAKPYTLPLFQETS